MTKNELAKIKASGRWPVKISDFYRHYFFVVLPLGCTAVGAIELYSGFKFHHDDLKVPGTIQLIIFVILSILVVKRLYQNQVFEKHQVPDASVENIKHVLKSLGFRNVRHHKPGYFVCTTRVSWFSWGEEITIIFDDNDILINSRPNNQPITILRDRKNIKIIMTALRSSEKAVA
ncbi:hypothetical protein [Mucilaginibacter sp.]|uniref:hypothetical protein n=1 Tax=Mucilaginibacter sp. TaxID=1882438 RepID=UPI002ED4E8F2